MPITIFDAIGNRFEDMIQEQFPDFQRAEEDNLPDFFNGKFRAEAKVGFWNYGVQLKEYQVKKFKRIRETPVIYIAGFHLFENALDRLAEKSTEEKKDILRNGMQISNAYLVSQKIIEKIWKEEHHISEKEQHVYCCLKRRHLDNIIEDNSFKRQGKDKNCSQYYHI
ncbi:hypothetical protein KW787_03860, partial [Candidatus Pacearchaeota archaeon]|nr:hypothetical protein [Candidatus Pacearchaeota archaeon]